MATSTTKPSSTGKTAASRTATSRAATSRTSTAKAASPAKPKAGLNTGLNTVTKTVTKAVPAAMVEPIKAVETPDPVFVEADADGAGLPMRKKELIDLVVERSGIKKKDAKPVVEAMLAVLGEASGSGRELNLQPLGKLRINRSVERSNGRIIVCKLRQSTAMGENSSEEDNTGTEPLAADEG